MIGILGNFFVGERIFQVVMQVSRSMEEQEEDWLKKGYSTNEKNLLAMWRGNYVSLVHRDY